MSSIGALSRGISLGVIACASIAVVGCANTVEHLTSPTPRPASPAGGSVHGGQQPIAGSLVRLFAAGNSGYGSAAILYATTVSASDGTGSFSFNKSASNTGPASPSTPSYGCPASGDPEMYITAVGGNSQGSGNSNNSAIAMAVAIGKCSTISSSTFINVNEVTTVATMAALQQFFSPAAESFGSPGDAQSMQGFVNAVSNITNLANLAAGNAVSIAVPQSQVAGVTLTLTPEYQKLNLEANILASCVNTSSSASQPCSSLFGATPAPAAAVTSQPNQTLPSANDTLEAIYYMLTNPSSGGIANMATLFNLAVPSSPFQPMPTGAPTDWTLGIRIDSASSTCGPNGGSFINAATSISSDASGNIWLGNNQASVGNLTALLPNATAGICTLGNIDGSQAGAALDSNGNVYFGGHNPGSSVIYRTDRNGLNSTAISTVNPTYSLAADNAGDVFYVDDSAGIVYKVPRGTVSSVSVGSIAQSSTDGGYIAVDGGQNIYYAGGTNGSVSEFVLATSTGLSNFYAAPLTISTGSGTDITSLVTGWGGTVWAVNSVAGSGSLIPITGGVAGPATALQAAGLSAPRRAAADGAGNIWVANASPNASGLTSISEFSATGAPLSPDGQNGGFQKAFFQSSQAITIDPSGNVWVTSGASAASTIVEVVGAGVPTISPTAVDHGVRPAPLRKAISGLIDMGDIAFHNFPGNVSASTTADFNTVPGLFGGYVINVTWAQLQPTQTTVVAVGNPIDTQLQMVRDYNAANPSAPLQVKLRVWPGVNAPDWAKALDGGPVMIYRNSGANKALIPVGHYWSPAYIAAWRTLQQQLSALYDNEPLISAVAVTSCSAQTDEPFVPSGDSTSLGNLYGAHYSSAAQTACLSGAIADYSSWHNASLDYTFNLYVNKDGPYQTPPTQNIQLPSFTFSVMNACRSALGGRCILNNHALNCPVDSGNNFVYIEMGALGGPVNFQTAAPGGLPKPWTPVVQQGILFGASAVELWDGTTGFPGLPPAQVTTLANLFTTQGSGAPCP